MGHRKREAAPKSWPVSRKGTKFIVNAGEKGIPLLIVLREMLGIARNRREVKKALINGDILISGKVAKDEKKELHVNDILTLVPSKKNFKIGLSEKGKFDALEISEKENSEKISKVVGKKILKGKKIQLNILDGRNFLANEKCNVNDSVVIDLKNNKIKKIISLGEKSKVLILGGKHSGKEGTVEKMNKGEKIAEVKTKEGKVNVLVEQLMAIE